jgi:hypothetical protein
MRLCLALVLSCLCLGLVHGLTEETVERHISDARALKKKRDFSGALAAVDLAMGAAATAAASLPQMARDHLSANTLFERGTVLACLERFDDAVDAHSQSFELLANLLDQGQPGVTEQKVQGRMLEIAQLYKWKALSTGDKSWGEDADAMLEQIYPTHPRQWPGGAYDNSLLKGARPWHTLAEHEAASPGWAAEVAAVVTYLQVHHADLVAEAVALRDGGAMVLQSECLFDPSRNAGWSQAPLFQRAESSLGGDVCSRDRATTAPHACRAVALLARRQCGGGGGGGDESNDHGDGVCAMAAAGSEQQPAQGQVALLRAAYSSVEGDAWIRPHAGPTNAQLKLHYGVTVPAEASGCRWWFVIDGERRQWREREAVLFDDSFGHEVFSECDEGMGPAPERTVLQLTFRHPRAKRQST